MGEVASHFSPGLRTLAAPASPRRSLARLTQPSEGAWLSPTNPPTLSPGARLAAQGPSPLWVATQMRDWSKGPHSHSPTAPSKDSGPGQLALPHVPGPHLLCGHRPLPRAAPAALAGATAVLRHLHRLLGFRPSRLSPPALRHVRSRGYLPLAPGTSTSRPQFGSDAADDFGHILM